MSHRRFFHFCLACTASMLITGCKVKRPETIIPEERMEELLYDYHLAKAMGDNLSYDENHKRSLYINDVFRKHEVTEAVFDSSLVWYTRHTELLSKIYERVNKRMKEEQNAVNHLIALRDKKPGISKPGDSINVWAWQPLLLLSAEKFNDRYTFVLPADSNFQDRDTLVWEVHYGMLHPDTSHRKLPVAVMVMQMIYEKDTLTGLKRISPPTVERIRLNADTLGALKEIRGFIYYTPSRNATDKSTLLAERISMIRYHCRDTLSFAVRDSLNKARMQADSLQKMAASQQTETTEIQKPDTSTHSRLTPEEMNRRRTTERSPKRPEQVETERRIQEEIREEQQRRMQQQRRRQESRRP